ncbi:MAG: flagellar basal body P-ring protein FlgI [Myxococcota bacterium]
MRRLTQIVVMAWIIGAASDASGVSSRIKEIADVRGARANQLVGYGIVVGLAGTGDDQRARFSVQSVASMLKQLGVRIDVNQLVLQNVAAVIVTAELPAFTAPGQRLDATVSSIGTAKSLQGGTLLMTPLKGADAQVYAVAQGPLSVGGFSAGGASGSSVSKNFTTVGRVPGGALVEREVPVQIDNSRLRISLNTPDFTTAVRIADVILGRLEEIAPEDDSNDTPDTDATEDDPAAPADAAKNEEPVGPRAAAQDAGTVVVRVPDVFRDAMPRLIAELEALEVEADQETKVVINERTGTVVLGERVKIAPVAIAHGGLTVAVQEDFQVSQPGPFARRGQTAVVPQSNVEVQEQGGKIAELGEGASLSDVVRALNALGVSPRDLVAILQGLRGSGALQAELVIQ